MEFDNETVQGVWEKARATNDQDPDEWRKDECGAWIKFDQYVHNASEYGCKIEIVKSVDQQELDNLRPFQHENSFVQATVQER